jgi:hypothetical protein
MEQHVAQAVKNADLFIRQCHSEDFLKLGRVGLADEFEQSMSDGCRGDGGNMANCSLGDKGVACLNLRAFGPVCASLPLSPIHSRLKPWQSLCHCGHTLVT